MYSTTAAVRNERRCRTQSALDRIFLSDLNSHHQHWAILFYALSRSFDVYYLYVFYMRAHKNPNIVSERARARARQTKRFKPRAHREQEKNMIAEYFSTSCFVFGSRFVLCNLYTYICMYTCYTYVYICGTCVYVLCWCHHRTMPFCTFNRAHGVVYYISYEF